MSGCNDSDFLEKPFTEKSVSRDLGPPFKRPNNTMALLTAMAVGAAAEPPCSWVIEGEAEGAEVGDGGRADRQ